jgi:hypothetical protein
MEKLESPKRAFHFPIPPATAAEMDLLELRKPGGQGKCRIAV